MPIGFNDHFMELTQITATLNAQDTELDMYAVITITATEHFPTFNTAWAYAQQLGQPYEMSFNPLNRYKV